MPYEIAYYAFCEEACPYKENRKTEPERWGNLEPCVNCPVKSFSEYLEKIQQGHRYA